MVRLTASILTMVIFSSANFAYAASLDEQIDDFFHQQLSSITERITINYPTPLPTLTCEAPTLSLVNKKNYWGKVTLVAQCMNKKSFISLNVEVIGDYVVAQQKIAAGNQITEQDIRLQSGRLDLLPKTVITNKDHVINYIASRNIDSEQTIVSSMIRQNWYAKAGQSSKVIIKGEGYQIESTGKPLTNGVLGDDINVRMSNGKVISGIVTENGIYIFHKRD